MSKFREILETLRTEIADGVYGTGRLPTESQLMGRFGVSRPTVARAMGVLQEEGVVNRRPGSGTFLKDTNTSASSLLGLIVPALGQTEIFDPICAEIARRAQECGYGLLSSGAWPASLEARVKQAEELCQSYIQQGVCGVFFAPVELLPENEAINQRILAALEKAHIRIVLLDRDLYEFPRRSKFDLVGIDNLAAGFEVARHLIRQGCKRIHFLALPYSAATVSLRATGWREAMIRDNLACGRDSVLTGDPSDLNFVRDMIHRTKTEAIICTNDRTAALLMQSLNQLGIRVPEDIRLAAFDDLQYARLLSVPLTTMRQPCRAIGDAAVEVMRERLQNPNMARRDVLLNAKLVIRKSCGGTLTPAGTSKA